MSIKRVQYFEDGQVAWYEEDIIDSTTKFKPGIYQPKLDRDGSCYAEMVTNKENHAPIMSQKIKDILTYIESFQRKEVRERINKIGFVHKLGILLFGRPGTMKTTFMNYVSGILISKSDAIVVDTENYNAAVAFVKVVRETQDNLIILLIDEADAYLEQFITHLKLLLDGGKSIENIIVIASTNKIELFEASLLRPSRFKLQVEFEGIQDLGEIEKILKEKGVKYTKKELNELKGCTIDEIKNFIVNKVSDIGVELKTSIVQIGFKIQDDDVEESTKDVNAGENTITAMRFFNLKDYDGED